MKMGLKPDIGGRAWDLHPNFLSYPIVEKRGVVTDEYANK
jgi:hypothetical protein